MTFDLSVLDKEAPQRWVRCGLEDMEIEIRHAGPRDQEQFRRRLVREGILRSAKDGGEIAPGRDEAFYQALAERYVTGWRNVEFDGEKNPPYDVARMGKVLGKFEVVLKAMSAALAEEADFFSATSAGSSS